MRIAIVAPSPVPFCIGGAEKLWWGLLEAINQLTPHHAELLKLPTRESTFHEVVESYQAFSRLDVSSYDLVISGKYPAWMVQHPNHVCYLLHHLRGLFDTYHFTRLPERYVTAHPGVLALQDFMGRHAGDRGALEAVFATLESLRQDESVPRDAFAFPGPFIREVVHFFDNVALAPGAIRKYTAISHNVKRRADYFPPGASVQVLHPPSNLEGFRSAEGKYFFTVSRLDAPKRIRLLVEAMRHVKADTRLLIAGTGPDAQALKELAAGDARIEFLGFVSDAQVLELYAGAIAVPYVPYDEDYGLVALEAMAAAKPVITTTDSGGPNELVRHGESGFSVAPEPEALAACIDRLARSPAEARDMGLRGKELAGEITWAGLVNKLLETPAPAHAPRRRRKLTVAVPFGVYPPRHGGQNRVFYLYRELAKHMQVDLVTLGSAEQPALDHEIAPGLREIRIPKSREHARAEAELEATVQVPITDLVLPRLFSKTPELVAALRASAESADVLVAEQPYFAAALAAVSKKPLWYDAQNVELDLKRAILPATRAGEELLEWVKEAEAHCCERAELVMVCLDDDARTLGERYGLDQTKVIEAANGVNLASIRYTPSATRKAARVDMGIDGARIALFMGSWHGPNLEAVRSMFTMAQGLPEARFLVLGGAGLAFRDAPVPPNVGFMGVVDDDAKDEVLRVVDVALNPMVSGSGTNLKMLDYFAAGVPVVSTPFGARGLRLRSPEHFVSAPVDGFSEAMVRLYEEPAATSHARVESARRHVEEHFAWEVIGLKVIAALTSRGLI